MKRIITGIFIFLGLMSGALQAQDTSEVHLYWQSSVDYRGNPVVFYSSELLSLSDSSLISSDSTTSLADSLPFVWNAGDTLWMVLRINATDEQDSVSVWTYTDSVIVLDGALITLPPPPPSEVEFASNWTSGFGGGNEAITDGGIWPSAGDPAEPNLSVIVQPGAWWPEASAFQIVHNETAGYVFHDETVPVPSVGEAVYHRFLFTQRTGGPANQVINNGNHGISSGAGTGGTANCAAADGDIWTLRFGNLGRDDDPNRYMFGIGRRDYWDLRFDLEKERAYVIEVALLRSTDSEWQIHPRLLDALTGEVIAVPSDFEERNNSNANLGQAPSFGLTDPGCLVRTYVGTNGAGGFSGVEVIVGAWATKLDVGLERWIGY